MKKYLLIPLVPFFVFANGKKDDTIAFVQAMQKQWKTVHSYQTNFEQTVTSTALGTEDKSTGTVSVKKPDKFRWESNEDGTLQLIQGNHLVVVQPKAQRGKTVVTSYKDIRTFMDPSFLKLLSGNLDIRATFNVSQAPSKDSKSLALKLVSKKNPKESYLAEISQKSYLLTALSFQSEDSQTEIRFKDIKTNIEIADSLFTYTKKSDDISYEK